MNVNLALWNFHETHLHMCFIITFEIAPAINNFFHQVVETRNHIKHKALLVITTNYM